MTFDNQPNQQNQQPSYGAVPGMPPAYEAPSAPDAQGAYGAPGTPAGQEAPGAQQPQGGYNNQPQQASYNSQPQQASYNNQQPQAAYSAPGAQNAPGTPLSGVLKRNPLGLAALVVGAIGILGSFLYAALQISFIRAGNMDVLGALGTTSTVLTALFGIAAVILGVVALLRRPASKAFASAGLALGGALLVETANALVYQIANSVL